MRLYFKVLAFRSGLHGKVDTENFTAVTRFKKDSKFKLKVQSSRMIRVDATNSLIRLLTARC